MNAKTKNVKDDEKTIKYPFSGIAPNLIDKFLVLGYNQKTIEFTFKNCNVEPQTYINTRFTFFEFEERPEVVNEICNDYSKDLLDNDLILELIFPNFPQMYFLEKDNINKDKEVDEILATNPYSIIFSINPQDNSGSKKSYNGLGYVFYVLQEHKSDQNIIDGYLYVPAAYVILSEFPYFYQFKAICSNICNQMKKESDEIPIDIIIYNIIKFAPSPINKNINLIFGNEIGIQQNKNFDIDKIIFNLYSKVKNHRNDIPSMFFPQLSGYPYIDINMSFIFNLIPPEIIIEVFIFSFLEHDIIFYSSKPDFLNAIMYIFSCFNYPFNDSIYYWHILSVSQDSFMSGTSTFVGKTSATMTGILSEYDKDIMTTKKIKEHFVLDIDNKNFFYLYQEENDEVKDTMALYTYIKNCAEDILNEKNSSLEAKNNKINKNEIFPDGIQLYKCISNLMEELTRRSKKVTSIDYNLSKEKPNFFNIYDDESEKICIDSNQHLQEAFFIFIMNIMSNFVNTNISKKNEVKKEKEEKEKEEKEKEEKEKEEKKKEEKEKEEKKEKKEKKDKEKKDRKDTKKDKEKEKKEQEEQIAQQKLKEQIELAKRAGKIFKEKLMDSSKYNSFVINYCQYHETIDLYKIPYNFINEFIYYSQNILSHSLNEAFIFDIIDQFYGKIKLVNLEKISYKKQNIKKMEYEQEKPKNNSKNEQKSKKSKKVKKSKKEIKEEQEKEQKLKNIEELKRLNRDKKKKEYEEYQNIYLFSFDNFSEYYQNHLRRIINREQEDDKEHFSKVKSVNRLFKKYKRNNYFLSQKILNIYITFINNNLNELLETFKLIKCEYSNLKKDSKNLNDDKLNSEKLSQNNTNNTENNSKLKEEDSKKNNSLKKSEVIKNKEINYLNLYQNRFNIDLDLKEKLFGIYNSLEIPNVIEDNLILQRYFSCYTLIKYSLLNILAMTREIESKIIDNQNVIQIIFDFCKKTKLKSKKYINIYLSIFKSIYKKNELLEKLKIKECLNLISIYLENDTLFLSEENKELLNDIKKSVDSSKISSNNEDFLKYVKKKGKFFEIDDGFFSTNKTYKFEDAIKTIETIYIGEYEDKKDEDTDTLIKTFDFNYSDLKKLFKEYKQNKENTSKRYFPKTPILLYDSTNKILKKYLANYSYDFIPFNELFYDIISLLFYFKIPNIGNKWINDNKKRNKESISESKKKDKKRKSEIDKQREQDKEYMLKSGNMAINEDEESSINDEELSEDSFINDGTLSSDKNETSQNIINDRSTTEENLGTSKYEGKDNDNELNEILKKIISILYDLYDNIKKKYKNKNK